MWLAFLRPSFVYIRESPNCAAFSVGCARPYVHITPILRQLYWVQLKLEFRTSYSCTPLLDHSTPVTDTCLRQPHSAGAIWRVIYIPSFRPICLEPTASPGRKCNNHKYVKVSSQTVSSSSRSSLRPFGFLLPQWMCVCACVCVCVYVCVCVCVCV